MITHYDLNIFFAHLEHKNPLAFQPCPCQTALKLHFHMTLEKLFWMGMKIPKWLSMKTEKSPHGLYNFRSGGTISTFQMIFHHHQHPVMLWMKLQQSLRIKIAKDKRGMLRRQAWSWIKLFPVTMSQWHSLCITCFANYCILWCNLNCDIPSPEESWLRSVVQKKAVLPLEPLQALSDSKPLQALLPNGSLNMLKLVQATCHVLW